MIIINIINHISKSEVVNDIHNSQLLTAVISVIFGAVLGLVSQAIYYYQFEVNYFSISDTRDFLIESILISIIAFICLIGLSLFLLIINSFIYCIYLGVLKARNSLKPPSISDKKYLFDDVLNSVFFFFNKWTGFIALLVIIFLLITIVQFYKAKQKIKCANSWKGYSYLCANAEPAENIVSKMWTGITDNRVVRVSVQSSEWSGGPFALLGEIGGHLLLYGRLEMNNSNTNLRTISIPIGSVTSIEPYFMDKEKNSIADIIGPKPSLDLERLANILDHRMTVFYSLLKKSMDGQHASMKKRMNNELWRLDDVDYINTVDDSENYPCKNEQNQPVNWIGFGANSFYSNNFFNNKVLAEKNWDINEIRESFPERMYVNKTYEGHNETTTLQEFYDDKIKETNFKEILITGFADSRGSYISNQQLSRFRAAMVFQGLIVAGKYEFPTHKVRIKGMGENWIASGPTSEKKFTNTGLEKNPDYDKYKELDMQTREEIAKGKPEYYEGRDWLRRVEICIVLEPIK